MLFKSSSEIYGLNNAAGFGIMSKTSKGGRIMQNAVDYSAFTEKIIAESKTDGKKPTLLLHVCCAPCSSYVLEYLSSYFEITLFYYNPNIFPEKEYNFRLSELNRFIREFPSGKDVKILPCDYEPEAFDEISKGLEEQKEGEERCKKCYALRLSKTAEAAKGRFDYFTTSLSISPYKNAKWLNEIGSELSKEYGVSYLFSDFKKKNGYKRSIELSKEYGLYRQDYCGCIFSARQAETRCYDTIDR